MGVGIEGVHHIGVSVPDLAKAREFYIDLLGGEEVAGASFAWRDNAFIDSVVGLPGSAAEMFFCRLGNTHIEVFEYAAPRSEPQDPDRGVNRFGYTHFALQVADLRACYDRIVAAGLRVHVEPNWDSIKVAEDGAKSGYAATYCRDFFGNVFEIMEIHTAPDMPRV
jgi:catechol 2,3-dioxygenase-like lactoylglutathione lyase family enzyme